MRAEIGKPLAQMCREFLRPLARILLRAGMTYSEFAQIAASAFVDVASGEFGLHGRPANVSRVAIITGLSRREVRRQRNLLSETDTADAESDHAHHWSPASRVLTGWHQDPEFADADGNPKSLPLKGERASFESLLKRYCGDIPHGAMASELERVGAIEIDNGHARVLSRGYVNTDLSPAVLTMFGKMMHDFTSTLEFNLQLGAGEHPWFQRVAYNTRLKPTSVKFLKKLVARDGQALLEQLDAWMSSHEASDDEDDHLEAGVGVYFYQDRTRTRSYKMTPSESRRARAIDAVQSIKQLSGEPQ